MARTKRHPALVYRCYSIATHANEHDVVQSLMQEVGAIPWAGEITMPYVFPLVTGAHYWFASAQVTVLPRDTDENEGDNA